MVNTIGIKENHLKKKNQKCVTTTAVVKENNFKEKQAVTTITLCGFCPVCWSPAKYYCPDCRLVGYCCMSHMANHWFTHQELCTVVNRKINENKGSLYNRKILNADDWRYARVKSLESIKKLLNRTLLTYERDVLLFPKYCASCFEIKYEKLENCKKCYQIWYCRNNKQHIPKSHSQWCDKLQLFSKLVRQQAEGKLFMFDMNFGQTKTNELNHIDNIEIAIKKVLNNVTDLDDCKIAMISQAASGPLTMLYALRIAKYNIKKSLTIHLIGAELHYEGNTLQAWETFFMHFITELCHLKIIMIGPELNATSTGDKIRLCTGCKSRNKSLTIQYEDHLLYHTYAKSKKFIKPDIVCAFNPGLHRSTGFNLIDTWPQTIQAAVANQCPFIFTAYTAYEAPLDLQRVTESAAIHIVQAPTLNPFASLKPDRNFISDHEAPLIFKNYYLSIVTGVL